MSSGSGAEFSYLDIMVQNHIFDHISTKNVSFGLFEGSLEAKSKGLLEKSQNSSLVASIFGHNLKSSVVSPLSSSLLGKDMDSF